MDVIDEELVKRSDGNAWNEREWPWLARLNAFCCVKLASIIRYNIIFYLSINTFFILIFLILLFSHHYWSSWAKRLYPIILFIWLRLFVSNLLFVLKPAMVKKKVRVSTATLQPLPLKRIEIHFVLSFFCRRAIRLSTRALHSTEGKNMADVVWASEWEIK